MTISSSQATNLPQRLNLDLGPRLRVVALFLLFRVTLDFAYATYVSKTFYYAGYDLHVNTAKLTLSYVLTIFFSFLVPHRVTRPSFGVIQAYYLLLVLPILSLWALRDDSTSYAMLVLASFGVLMIVASLPTVNFRFTVPYGQSVLVVVTLACAGYIAWIFYTRGGLRFATLNLGRIYDVRSEASSEVFYGFASYAKEWLGKAFIPACLALFLWRRTWTLVVLCIVVELGLGLMTTAKEYMLYPFFITFCFVVLRRGWSFPICLSSVFVVTLCAAIALAAIPSLAILPAIVAQRGFFAAPNLTYVYYHFFQENPFVYLTNSPIPLASEYPYHEAVPTIIGAGLWGKGTATFANTGIFGTGYMHFGALGVVTFSALAGMVLKLLDMLVIDRLPLYVGFAILITAALQFINGDLLTAVSSHGIGIAVVALALVGERGSPHCGQANSQSTSLGRPTAGRHSAS